MPYSMKPLSWNTATETPGVPQWMPLKRIVESVEPSPNEMIGSAAAIALCSGNHSIIVLTGEI